MWKNKKWILKTTIAVTLFAVLFGYSIQPTSFQYVLPTSDGNNFLPATESTEGAKILLGTSSHILPLVRFINFVGEPVKQWLIPLDVETMKADAIKVIGHDDFGNDLADWEAYHKLVDVANECCHLLGRLGIKGTLENILKFNLKIQQMVSQHPEILDETIEQPIILAAFTRTGATFLYQVLADVFQEELMPTLSYEIFGGPIELYDPPRRKEEAELNLKNLGAVNPPMKLLHEWIAADEPEDEPGWYQYTVQGLVIPFTMPSTWHHLKIYEDKSQERNLKLWETLQKIRQWQAGGSNNNDTKKKKRFLMKAPEHLFGFPQLYNSHPDATFVTVSREEESWYPSALIMTQLFQQMFVHPRVNETIEFNDILNCGQRRSLQRIKNNSTYGDNVLHIKFGSYLFTQTIEVVQQIAQKANLPWDDATQMQAKQVIAKRLSWKKGKAVYNLQQFGLTKEIIHEKLSQENYCSMLDHVYQ
mmetsp:Transcript_14279/g.22022  ORF Transcript_14279/g.22022 Transcript_14279/m.22022 type:complete len:475 (+) Transcript_14279:79-1503(+)